MKKTVNKTGLKIGAIALTGLLCASAFVGCSVSLDKDLSGYVAVDINPSVEFITDAKGYVTEVRAVNYDGEIVISDMELVGKKIDVAVEELTAASEDTGYINDTNTDVSITVGANDEKAQEKLNELAEKGAKRGSEKIKIQADKIKLELEEEVKKIKNERPEKFEDLTVVKLKLIKSIQEYDETFTVEIGVEMEVKELVDLLKSYIGEFEDVMKGEKEIEFREKVNERTAEIRAQIDAIFGEEYVEKMALLRKLELLEDKFDYLLDRADVEDDETLTAEMIAELEEVIGTTEITTLDELEDYIETIEDEVEEIRENANLTVAQKEMIRMLENSVKEMKRVIKTELELTLGDFEKALKDMKEMRKEEMRHPK